MLWGILLLAASAYLIRWAAHMTNNYWEIMTIPAKIVSFAIPLGVWAITGLVWCSIILKYL
jgi:hypothetical protein